MRDSIILETINLHKVYKMPDAADVHVLKGIDMQIREGEIVTILGPSGVGKSTLLHVIGALDRPTQGSVKIDGHDLSQLDDDRLALFRNKTVGFVFQFHHLLPEFTALENVMMPGMIGAAGQTDLRAKSLNLLAQVGLEHRAHHRPQELSGGEQQRVAVARAMVNRPRLILADEPSGNLDVHTAESLHELLWSISRDFKQTLVIVTHNQELSRQADRYIELYDGKIKTNQIKKH
ncbi:ATP-binding cassette domain-containing protein [candidate division KSB1 bacterium]|nr:ATP-binding cassette domain-containing protein [candidate division KSB1 bacterium]